VLLDNLVDVSILNHLQELLHVCLHLLSSLAHLLSLLWIHQRGELRTGRSLSYAICPAGKTIALS
jgi:hypothetical protein